MTIKYVFPWPYRDGSACARKFCFTNTAVPFNQNNLKWIIDNCNITGSNRIGKINDILHNDSH